MKRTFVVVVAVVATLAFPTAGRANDKDKGKDKDKGRAVAVQNAVVDFGEPQPQGTPAAATHFLKPVGGVKDGEATILKDGTVTFRVNGGGHGVSVYRVSKDTTRDDIIGTGDGLCPTRSGCLAAFIAAAHTITDGKGNVVVDIGDNPPFGRVDDAARILVGTTALIPAVDAAGKPILDAAGNQVQVAGIFHQGTAATRAVAEQIRVKFTKNGRYLVICMNRNHSINDHMFSFVNVVGDDDDDN